MRLMIAAFTLPLLAGSALNAEPQSKDLPAPGYERQFEISLPPRPGNCQDRIEAVRTERGLSSFDRENANPEDDAEALMIYAVYRNINGCDVLVMANNSSDVRPLPQYDKEDWRVRPAQ